MDAKVTITMTASEFDLLRDALEARREKWAAVSTVACSRWWRPTWCIGRWGRDGAVVS